MLGTDDVDAQVEGAFGERLAHGPLGREVGEVHVAALGAGQGRRQPQSVQDGVRAVAEQPAVLHGSRFALLAVGDDDTGARRVADGPEFDGGREPGAAPPAQSRRGDPVEQPSGRHQGRVAARGEVPGDVLTAGRGGEEAGPSFGKEGVHAGHTVLLGSMRPMCPVPAGASAGRDRRWSSARSSSRRWAAVRS